MKTIQILSAATLLFATSIGFAAEPFLECSVEEFGSLKNIEIFNGTKPGVAIELVETVLEESESGLQLVRKPASAFAIRFENFYVLNTCGPYPDCNLQKLDFLNPAQWRIHACTDMAHNMGCSDYPVTCVEK